MTEAEDSPHHCGTYLIPDASIIRAFVSRLRQTCVTSVSKNGFSLVDAHNAMALYTLQMLSFASGHRSVTDPFFDINTFDTINCTVIIEEKVISTSHQARVAWLPHQAILQFQYYLSHLRSLSRFIRQHDSVLADQIWSVTEPNYPHPLPLFFFLQKTKGDQLDWIRIRPLTIKTMLGNSWILPQNTNRHLLSSWLHSEGCHPEVIDAQLGHIEAGCSPFSSRSVLDPSMIGRLVIPYLDIYLQEQGWIPIEGLNAPRRLAERRPKIDLKHLIPTESFGPHIRSENREALLRRDAEAVLILAKDLLPKDKAIEIPDADIDALQDKIIKEAPDGRVLIRLTLFRRHLSKLKRNGTIVKVPGRLAIIKREEACFNINSIKAASVFNDIRSRFHNYLSARLGKDVDLERRLAEIIISASLFGAQSSPRFLDAVSLSIKDRIHRMGDGVCVDISSSPLSPIRRWMPDQMSWTLLLGYWKSFAEINAPPSSEKLYIYLFEIIHFIGAPLPKSKSKKQTLNQLVAPLLYLSQSWWKFRLPGVIRGYAEGNINCASIPLSNWLRLLTKSSGTLQLSLNTSQISKPYDDIVPIRQLDVANADYKQAKAYWDDITKIIGVSTKEKANGKIGNAEARSNARKQTIVKDISTLLNDNSNAFSPIACLIAAWIIHLCRNGTSHLPNLRANSVCAYSRSIGWRLISLGYELDFLSSSDLLIEEVYRNALGTVSDDNRSYVAARLKEFHAFLVSAYAMPTVDWSEVIDDDSLEAEAVDAGIITMDEYYRALDNLSGGPDCIDRFRLRNVAVLFFAYRFGLRTGEIFRLTISDIIMNHSVMIIYVRNSVFGETKTDNGVRQLPLIGTLSDLERNLISKWLTHIETYADGDHLAALMSQLGNSRDITDRSSCVRAVVEELRSVTGDTQIRLRHLRHTCATRLFLSMLFEEVPSGILGSIYHTLWGDITPKDVRQILIGDRRLTRRGLYAMALFMGHVSPDVTHRHYVHLADISLNEWVNKHIISIDDKALSYAYQTSYANIRKAKSRIGMDAFQTQLSEHFTRQSTIPIPKLLSGSLRAMSTSDLLNPDQSLPTPADVDRILSTATLRNSIDGLADRFLTTDKVVFSVLLAAAKLQEQTGFTTFSIPQLNPDDFWIPIVGFRRDSLEKESQRVRQFLDALKPTILSSEQFDIAIQAWIGAYVPHSTCLIINKRSELEAVLDAMRSLGIPSKDFEAFLPEEENKNVHATWVSIQEWLISKGLSVRFKKRLAHCTSRLCSDVRMGLMLRASDSHSLGYQHSLNRVLFVISVWREMNKCISSSSTS